MNVAQQSEQWLQQLAARKRKPVAPTSLATYRSGLRCWVLPRLGHVELIDLKNRALKGFVTELAAAGLAPASVNSWVNVVKAIVASATDEEGERLHPRNWDNNFVDLPVLAPGSQKQPYIAARTIEKAISGAPALHSALYALLAATGLRIGEALALRFALNEEHTSWWPGDRLIRVRSQILSNGTERDPKKGRLRDIDVSEELNVFLTRWVAGRISPGELLFQNRVGSHVHRTTARADLVNSKIPAFHCFRRFRLTHLRAAGVPEDIVKFWIGHSAKDVTDRYSKLAQLVKERRSWVESAGLGFKLPERDYEQRTLRRTRGDVLHDVPGDESRISSIAPTPGDPEPEDYAATAA